MQDNPIWRAGAAAVLCMACMAFMTMAPPAQAAAEGPVHVGGVAAGPASTDAAAAPPMALPLHIDPAYALAAGDLLRIQVYQQPDLSLELRIQDNGRLTYPLLGSIALVGLTVEQAERRIEEGLRQGQFLRQPQVNVTVMQVRGHLVSVLGHVQRPGRFPIERPGLRLSELLAQAGGVTAIGADRLVLVGRRLDQPYRLQLDLAALFDAHEPVADPVVEHGDVVFIDRAPVVYLYGEVQRPGPVRLERHMTVLQALAAGGGPTLRGTTRGLKITRRDERGALQRWTPELGLALQPGDVLHVPESLF